jgi:hypothetical protein
MNTITKKQLEAKIREGLEELDCGKTIDGEKFFDRWRTRLSARIDDTPAPIHSSQTREDQTVDDGGN